jgi:hypothetical protein
MNNTLKYYKGVDYETIFNGCDVWAHQVISIKGEISKLIYFKILGYSN